MEQTLQPTSSAKARKPWWKICFNVLVYAFALAGLGIIGAWGAYQLGLANNKGAVDENYRYLMSVSEMEGLQDSTLTAEQLSALWMQQYARLAAFGKYYPENARLILQAAQQSGDPMVVDRMLAAVAPYAEGNADYQSFMQETEAFFSQKPQQQSPNVIPWMATVEWQALRESILKDSALLVEAGRISGVEPRLIVGCLVGEQIRLFNSNRETFKKYLGPVKVLSVQSQFSYGVNGIKDFTAAAVEEHLKDPNSPFYMGKRYENILDFETDNHADERYRRLVDYRNHLYSYIYTGCILHQTMLQWRRAGYDISDRPDILFTLFNVGFSASKPKPDPQCGGSHITVDGHIYTFGRIGFDFYYSGELAHAFPYWKQRFVDDDGQATDDAQVRKIQSNMSDCSRPERGHEYRQQPKEPDAVLPSDSPYAGNPQMSPREAEANDFQRRAR